MFDDLRFIQTSHHVPCVIQFQLLTIMHNTYSPKAAATYVMCFGMYKPHLPLLTANRTHGQKSQKTIAVSRLVANVPLK